MEGGRGMVSPWWTVLDGAELSWLIKSSSGWISAKGVSDSSEFSIAQDGRGSDYKNLWTFGLSAFLCLQKRGELKRKFGKVENENG